MDNLLQKMLKFAILYVFFMIFWSICDFQSTIITILLLILANMGGKYEDK
tara:strand:- start:274 stop:423 length:150 start_codon:yes stop_codon:yes gene_type:complete